MAVLDVGCGPGTITVGLARRAREVIGVDASAEMVDSARRLAADEGIGNASFEVGSAYDLPYADSSFDVVYAHQVMQHLADPVRALREARRVLRPGGLVAVRGLRLRGPWCTPRPSRPSATGCASSTKLPRPTEARPTPGASCRGGCGPPASWIRSSPPARPPMPTPRAASSGARCGSVRVTDSDFAQHAVSGGFATRSDLVAISVAFRRWADHPSGFWAWLNGEVVGVKPG